VKFPVAKNNFSRKRELYVVDLLRIQSRGYMALNKSGWRQWMIGREVSHMIPSPHNVSVTQPFVWCQTSVRIANASAKSRISRVKLAKLSCSEIRRGQISGKKKNLRGLSPRANYTDRAAAAGQRSANFCGYRGVTWSAQRIPMTVNLRFLDRSR